MNDPKPAEISALWTAKQREFTESRKRIRLVRQWLARKVEPEIPAEFQAQAKVGVKLAFPLTTSLHTISIMARKRPLLKRTPIGSGMSPMQKATRIESWANGCLTELECQAGPLWKPLVASLFNQGEVACLAYPMMAHWEDFPDFNADNPPERHQRDRQDREPSDDYYGGKRTFVLDGKRTQKAFDEYANDYKAHRIPLVARIVPAEQCLPIPGPGGRLDGLLIKSYYTEDDLREQGYSWAGGTAHPGVGRTDSDSGGNRSMCLMELWKKGGVAYYAGETTYGMTDGLVTRGVSLYEETTRRGGSTAIDLEKEYGLNKLLAHYAYGLHLPDEENPDLKGVPFLWPFIDQIAAAQNLITAKVAHTWRWAYGGVAVQADPDMPSEMLLEDGAPRKVVIPPMTAVVVPGQVTPLVHPGTAPEVDQSIGFLLGDVRNEMPSAAAMGGDGAASGHDRSLIRAHLEDAYGMVLGDADDYSGALGAWRWLGSTLVECASAVAKSKDMSVPVYVSAQTNDGERRKYSEMTAGLCDGLYDLTAFYPNAEGENLPWAQLLAEWTLQELIPQQMFLEKGMGDQSPERTIVDIQVEKFLFKTPQGQQILGEMVVEQLGGEREQEAFKLQQEGRLSPDGTPTDAMQGVGGQGQLTGTAVPNGTDSALGGIIAGGLQTGQLRNDAAATMAA